MDVERRAERASGIAGRGLYPEVLERALAHDASVGHAVEGHAARHAQVAKARPAVEIAGHPENDLLGHLLYAGGHVEVELLELRLALPDRLPEELRETRVGHREPVGVGEVFRVQFEGPVFPQIHQLPEDEVGVLRPAIGGCAHHLVFGAVDLESEVVGEGAVEKPQRVGEADLPDQLEGVAASHALGGRRPLADAVEGQDRGLLEGGGQERRRGVGLVVLGEEHLALEPEALLELLGHPQLLPEPDRHGLGERRERAREGGQVGEEDPLELDERLVVEDHIVEIAHADAPLLEAIPDGALGDRRIVALSREALFVGGGHQPAVLHEGCRGVVVEAGDAQDVHGAPRLPVSELVLRPLEVGRRRVGVPPCGARLSQPAFVEQVAA